MAPRAETRIRPTLPETRRDTARNKTPLSGTLFALPSGMTRRRIIEPRTTWALSRRTTRRHFLLNPDQARQLEGCYWYCLGLAAQRFAIVVRAGCLMSTRSHEVATGVRGVLPRFLQEFHRLLALTTKALRGWPGAVCYAKD
jgi:putative transposase